MGTLHQLALASPEIYSYTYVAGMQRRDALGHAVIQFRFLVPATVSSPARSKVDESLRTRVHTNLRVAASELAPSPEYAAEYASLLLPPIVALTRAHTSSDHDSPRQPRSLSNRDAFESLE